MEKIINFLETKTWLPLIILLILSGLAYSNILANSFVWDDPDFYGNWAALYSFSNIDSLLQGELPAQHSGVYRPARSIFQLFFFQLFGGQNQLLQTGAVNNTFGYHLISILIHLAAVAAVYLLIKALTEKKLLSWLVALLFGLHPIHTEAITFFTPSIDVIGVVFFLYALYFYLKSDGLKNKIFYLTSVILSYLAFFSYEFTLMLPAALILLDLYKNNFDYKVLTGKIKYYLPYLGGVIVWIIIRINLPIATRAFSDEEKINLFSRLLTTSKAFAQYLYLIFIPYPQTVYHKINIAKNLGEPAALLSIILLLGLLAMAIIIAKKYKIIAFSVFWFFLSLAAASNIFPTGALMAERYTYLASLSACLILGWLIYLLLTAEKKLMTTFGLILFLIIAAGYGAKTVARNFDWQNNETLWQKTLESRPDDGRVWNNVGYVYAKEKNFDEAIKYFDKAKELQPSLAITYRNLGNVFDELGQYQLAITNYEKAIELQPSLPENYNNLGVTYQNINEFDQALAEYKKAAEADRFYYVSFSNMGVIYLLQEEYTRAQESFEKALAVNPNFGQAHHGLAVALVNLKQIEPALEHYQKSIELMPELIDNYIHLASIYYQQGETQKATEILELGIAANPDSAELKDSLGAVLAE